jgi:hypothetical protein
MLPIRFKLDDPAMKNMVLFLMVHKYLPVKRQDRLENKNQPNVLNKDNLLDI